MKNKLQHIIGFNIPNLPEELTKLGDLMFFDGPLMSVYINQESEPYIYDWVDSNDECNRWLLYKTDKAVLADYIYGKKSHFEVINNPVNSIVFSVDKNPEGKIVNCIVLSPKNLPYDYLPSSDSMFEKDDSINLNVIIETLKLDDILKSNQNQLFDILQEAKKNNNELVNLHIKSSTSKVGYGKIYSSILGQVLSNYHNLGIATALNIFDQKGKLQKDERPRRKKGELSDIKELAEMEFIYAKAASFSVFLRPIKRQTDLFDNETSSEKITKSVFNLFEASNDINKLKEIKASMNEGMLTAYNKFLKEIKEQDITLAVQYGNPDQNYKLEQVFNSKRANDILANLDNLEYENIKEIKVKGFFKALDSISSSFKFETNDNDIYPGKFSNQLKEGILNFNLKDYYSATIEIFESKKTGLNNMKEKITMVSCIKNE